MYETEPLILGSSSDIYRYFLGILFSAGGFVANVPGNSKGYDCDFQRISPVSNGWMDVMGSL